MSEETQWRVVPLSEGQRLDVRDEDILEEGLYRKCDTYRGGGGYDEFPDFCERWRGERLHEQFVVQIYGCNLDCPYCYVTREGVWGNFERVSTTELIEAFERSGQEVFHLMGGAPALQLENWREIEERVEVFHSDLMLCEKPYQPQWLEGLDSALIAINVKGIDSQDWKENTRKAPNWDLFWRNWKVVESTDLSAYVTFTGVDRDRLPEFWSKAASHGVDADYWEDRSYVIDLIDYEATDHVDDTDWGG